MVGIRRQSSVSLRISCLRWATDRSGVTLWPNIAFLPKVLSDSHRNQPIRLARYDPPPGEGADRPELCVQCGPWRLILQQPHVFGGQTSSSSASVVPMSVALFPSSVCPTGSWTPLVMPTKPITIRCRLVYDAIPLGVSLRHGLRRGVYP